MTSASDSGALNEAAQASLVEFRAFCDQAAVQTAGLGAEHVDLAIDAFRRFGKGRHPAGLNYSDCFFYALAKATGEPLLFKGSDFAQTDIGSVA